MYFPMFVELASASCLVVGDGAVARRKAATLRAYGAEVSVSRAFAESDLEGRALVVAATDDRALNARVAARCRARRIPVNAVDDAAASSFIFGAAVRRCGVVAAVSTGGRSPVAAQHLRDRIAPLVTNRFAAAVERLGALRASHRGAAFFRRELARLLGETDGTETARNGDF